MSVDLLGPANAANATTTRPADTRAGAFGATDTFFKDCSSPTAKDGTKIQAGYLNAVLQQLRRAIRGMAITEDNTSDDMLLNAILAGRDYYLIDTAITKTVHGTGADFADLNAALEYLSKYRITKNGSVLLSLAAGKFNYAAPVTIAHPNAERISIVGATMLAAAPTAANFAGTGNTSGARASDGTTNLAMLRAKYATELSFTGANGVTLNGNIALLDKLLITSDGTGGGVGVNANLGPVAKVGAVSIHGFGGVGWYQSAGLLAIGTCLTASGCGSSGVVFANYANCTPAGGTICTYGNGGNGLAINAGWELDPNATSGILSCSFNAVHGCFVSYGEIVAGAGSTFNGNGGNGLSVSFGAANAQNAFASNNGGTGVVGQNGARLVLTGLTASGNVSGNITATGMSFAVATGFAGGALSPAANTVGNNNSLISV